MSKALRALRPKGRRRGPRRPGLPTYRAKARRARGAGNNDWFAVFEHGVGDPKAMA